MTDKVQKIKDWIGKEQDGLMDAKGNFEYPEHEGAYHILCNLNTYIDSMPEEPVSEDLDMEIDYYLRELQSFKSEHGIDCYTVSIEDMDEICRHFANWQKEQDQSIIELAEDHAVLAGMEKMKEQMMNDAVEQDVNSIWANPINTLERLGLQNFNGKVKLIIIKEE